MHSLIFNIQILLTVHRNSQKERLITKQTNQYELFNPFYFIQVGVIKLKIAFLGRECESDFFFFDYLIK